eukprot:1247196-Amphidinium_carterae.1
MSVSHQRKYHKQAEVVRAMREHDIQEAVQAKLEEVKVIQAQHTEPSRDQCSTTMTYSSSRLGPDEIAEYDAVRERLSQISHAEVSKLAKGPRTPEPVHSDLFEQMRSLSKFGKHAPEPLLDVAKSIVRSRDHFINA